MIDNMEDITSNGYIWNVIRSITRDNEVIVE